MFCALCVCVRACVRACVRVCGAHVTNLLMEGLVTCHSGGVANGSSPGPDSVADTRQGQSALELAL